MSTRGVRRSLHPAAAWWLRALPTWACAVTLAVLLAGSWLVTHVAGGTQTALPHVFYIPIVIAALPFGLWGGLVAAIVATILCGPLMPLDVATGEAQEMLNWLTRGAFFVAVGMVSAATTRSLRASYQRDLEAYLQQELDLGGEAHETPHPTAPAEIHAVLGSRAFHPVFQPIYSLRDGRLVAMEALTRFETEPYQPPDVWFALAAEAGLGTELELAAVEAALDASADVPDGVALSLNCSPRTVGDPRLLDAINRHPCRPVIIEVTEHAVVDDYGQLETALGALRQAGVRLAVDDAGAGFASLRHIVRLAPEVIKLDTSLTQELRHDPVRRALANCLIQFAHDTGSQLVAEGIEERTDLTTWQELGAHAAQGYLLARPGPLPAPPVCELISSRSLVP